MDKLEKYLLKRTLAKVVKNNCPTRIPRSGKAGAEIRCYSTYIKLGGEYELLVKDFDGENLTGYQYSKELDRYDEEATIHVDWLTIDSLEIEQYIGYFSVTYTDLWDFVLFENTKLMALLAFYRRSKSNLAQYLFNKRQVESKKRHELLKFLIENYGSMKQEFHLITLLHQVYSAHMFRHPDKDKLKELLDLQLDSFVQTGELVFSNSAYRLTGRAIITLENFQIEARRHKVSMVQQWLMIALTLVLAFIGLVQAKVIELPVLLSLKN
ncbi:hypothetical protein [Vibrio splendidus]|uniref:hypothetical protein n=1 Tax=Vibrio splendidus TaxID=29497 RepID=UPI0002EEA5C2|nr:hypothetical protein [Vibrio splendidus]